MPLLFKFSISKYFQNFSSAHNKNNNKNNNNNTESHNRFPSNPQHLQNTIEIPKEVLKFPHKQCKRHSTQ